MVVMRRISAVMAFVPYHDFLGVDAVFRLTDGSEFSN